jgi:PAT family beta-lactamase induction signal transducer AmpG
MMMPGMFSGAIQQQLGYENFFLYAMLCGIPSLAIATMVDIPADFGVRVEAPVEAFEPLASELA